MAGRTPIGALENLAGMPLKPLTRVRMSKAAVKRAEQALTRARLRHAKDIIAAHEAGHSYAVIGRAIGLTSQRVSAFVSWAEEQRQRKEPQ
jgi:hypothetical protein